MDRRALGAAAALLGLLAAGAGRADPLSATVAEPAATPAALATTPGTPPPSALRAGESAEPAATLAVTAEAGSSTLLVPPLHEGPVRRFEDVFFIALPFTSLYATLGVSAAGMIAQKGRLSLTPTLQDVGMGVAALSAALIAWHDVRAPDPPAAGPQAPAGP